MAAPYAEFLGNKRLMWLAQEWLRNSERLSEWAMERIVNRRDVWSQYTLKNGQISVVMLPIKERRAAGTDMVTLTKLQRHFAGKSPAHLIGLHSISDHSTCKWFAIDVDLHDDTVPNAGEIAAANLTAALEWSERLRRLGMDPILMDSNGAGGYHVWCLLDREYPLADVYDFVDKMRSDWEAFGLPRKPEIFPPKREVGPDDLPYTLRLLGRHHTRLHYTRIWNFDSFGENDWLEGEDAIDVLLSTRATKLPKLKKPKPRKATLVAAPQPKPRKAPTTRKFRVCVDLDGVLAKYDRWRGIDHIGEPIDGARQFMTDLAKVAEIVVFTSRCSSELIEAAGSNVTVGLSRVRVIEWLEKNKIPYSDVYVGQGKPRAAAFIDDRGVGCNPQQDADAYVNALALTKMLVKKPHGLPEAAVAVEEANDADTRKKNASAKKPPAARRK